MSVPDASTPVDGVKVEIIDVDALGQVDDIILTITTDQ